MSVTTDFAVDGIHQADKMIDELDAIMTKLESIGIITGWEKFMEKKEEESGGT